MPGLYPAPGARPAPRRRSGTVRQRWQPHSLGLAAEDPPPPWIQPGCLAAPPQPEPAPRCPATIDTIAIALAADARHAGREAWLGLMLGAGVVGLLVLGWLVPLLAAAFVAAPVIGLGLGILDDCRQRAR